MVKENTMKQTEIGLLPEEWDVKKLGEVISYISYGFTNPMPTTNVGIWMVTANDVKNGKINFKTARKTSIEAFNKYLTEKSKPKQNDLLLTKDGTLGRLAVVGNEVICINQSVAVIKTNKYINVFFLKHLLQDNFYQKVMIENAGGSTIKHIYITVVDKMPIIVPPLPEQEAIAEALSDADAWIGSLEQLIAKKRLIKQGAMQELLTLKEDWEVKKLGEVVHVYRGGSPRPIQDFITDKSDGINWIKIGDTSSSGKYIVSTNEKITPDGEKNSRRVYPGDFLLSNSMSFGRPYILKIDGCIHDGWLVLQNYKAYFDTEFLYYLLTSKYVTDQYKSKAAGSGVLNLNKEVVSTVELIIPSLTEQTCIATILSDMDAELEALEGQLGKAKQIKQGMMQELLTGRVRLV
ncbi:restriction endonuclease subunit S [Chryseobacterium vrystaatense]|uniref:restriction endonuclease subunit S n=1 Tax=Chryseobacterium vrystaatense TaxID=307480 RepID=UPI00068FF80D|nr:restriction endonuclease subunit S [Chryseobacterium vrystaatense]